MSITRILSDDSYEAAENATGQSATNPFATESVTNSLQSQINALAPGNAVLTGGVSYSGTGFIYDVSALTYRIAGNLYTSALTQVTLNAADPTFDRIDVIYADDNGLVGKITGTPSASPVKPQVDNATQVEVSFVTVGAGATAPSGLTIVDVYLEDAGTPTEWAGTSDFGANFAATADPHSGTKHIDTGAGFTTPNKEMIFTPLAPYTINGGNLNFWLNPQVSLSGPQKGFFVGFYVSGGLVGNSVQIAGVPFITYGFDPLAPLNVYQLVSIPISAFGALPATIDELRMFKTAGPPSATDMYIDDVQIQEGIPASGGGSIDATAVTYTPTTPGDWSVVPDDVAEALDTLAAAPSGSLPTLEDEGTPVTGGPHNTYDYVGAGVTVNDAGGGQATINIPGTPNGAAGGDLAGTYPNPTVGTNKITNSKAAQMAANTIKSNPTGSLANAQDLAMPASTFLARLATGNIVAATVTQVRTLLGLSARKDHGNVTNAGMLAIATPGTGDICFNTTWGLQYWFDGNVWLNPNLIKCKNGNPAAVMVEGNPVVQDGSVAVDVEFSTAPTSQDTNIVGVVKDVYTGGTVGSWVTIAVSGEHNVLCTTAAVSIGDKIYNSGITAGQAFASAGSSFGCFAVSRAAKGAGSSGLLKCFVTPTERF